MGQLLGLLLGHQQCTAIRALQASSQASGGAGSINRRNHHGICMLAASLFYRLSQNFTANRALQSGSHRIGCRDFYRRMLPGSRHSGNDNSLAANSASIADFTRICTGRLFRNDFRFLIESMGKLFRYRIGNLAAGLANALLNTGSGAGSVLNRGCLPHMVLGVDFGHIVSKAILAAAAHMERVALCRAGSFHNGLHIVVAQGLFAYAIRVSNFLGLVAVGALDQHMLVMQAVGRNVDGVLLVPLVTQGLGGFFLGLLAARALKGIQAALFAGGCYILLVLRVQDKVVAQRLGTFHRLHFLGVVAVLAGLAYHCRLGAGSIPEDFLQLMLAGCGNGLFLGILALGADIAYLAVLAAGGISALDFLPVVAGFGGLVAQVLAADGAGVLCNALGGAGCFLQHLGNFRLVGILVHRGLIVLVAVAADRAGIGGVAALLAGCGDNLLLVLVTLGGLGDPIGICFYIGLLTNFAGVQNAGSILTGGILVDAVVPLVAQGLGGLFLGLVAARALKGIQAALFAGGCYILLVLRVQDKVVAQRLGTFHRLHFLGVVAVLAGLAYHCRLGAGSIPEDFLQLMLAGCGNGLFLGILALGADIAYLAVLAAGGISALDFLPVVAGFGGLVAQVLAADGAGVLCNALGGAGCFLQHLGNFRLVGILVHRGLIVLVAVAADRAGIGGVAALLAGCGGDNLLILVALGRLGQLSLIGVHFGCAADGAGVLGAGRIHAVRCLILALIPLVAQGLGGFFLSVIAVFALEGVQAALFTGSSLVVLVVGIQNQLMAGGLGAFNDFHFAFFSADRANLADLCRLGAGSVHGLLFPGVLAGCGYGLFLGLTAHRAEVSNLAVLAAGSILAPGLFPHMISRDRLVAQAHAANLAHIVGNALCSAGCRPQDLSNNGCMGRTVGGKHSILVAVAAAAALVEGIALILTGGCNNLLLEHMAQCRLSQLALKGYALCLAAALAGPLDTGGIHAVGLFNDLFFAPLMAKRSAFHAVGDIAAAALPGVEAALGAGCCLVTGQCLINDHVVTQSGAQVILQDLNILLTVMTMQHNTLRCRTGCFSYFLFGMLMCTLCFGSKSRGGQHGEYHHECQKRSQNFSLHDITSKNRILEDFGFRRRNRQMPTAGDMPGNPGDRSSVKQADGTQAKIFAARVERAPPFLEFYSDPISTRQSSRVKPILL